MMRRIGIYLAMLITMGATYGATKEEKLTEIIDLISEMYDMQNMRVSYSCLRESSTELVDLYPNISKSLEEMKRKDPMNLLSSQSESVLILQTTQKLMRNTEHCLSKEKNSQKAQIIQNVSFISFAGLYTVSLHLNVTWAKELTGLFFSIKYVNNWGKLGKTFGRIIHIILFENIFPEAEGERFSSGYEKLGMTLDRIQPTHCDLLSIDFSKLMNIILEININGPFEMDKILEKLASLLGLSGDLLTDGTSCAYLQLLQLYDYIANLDYSHISYIVEGLGIGVYNVITLTTIGIRDLLLQFLAYE